ncbi:MAG: glycosyltransferase [Ignavibacteriae bacterium]|nr:glycosyltransferase [Ignavibacteriota bacterium]
MMELSIIIPAFDEARKIAADVDAAGMFLADNNIDGEIIVVDDGSTDGTGDAALRGMLQFRIPLTVITLQHHAGKGAAVRAGIMKSEGAYVMFADAGLTVPYTDALRGLALLKSGRYQLAHGSRWLPESRIEKPQDPWRQKLSRIVRWILLRTLSLPKELTDTQCGFKMYQGDVARALFSRCTTEHFLFDVEVLVLALQQGYRMTEFPVSWSCDSDSRLKARSHAMQVITDLLAIRRLSRRFPTRS